MNLMEGLLSEMNRARELQKQYEEIGTPGLFGAAMIRGAIAAAEGAIASNDVVAMLTSYAKLKELE